MRIPGQEIADSALSKTGLRFLPSSLGDARNSRQDCLPLVAADRIVRAAFHGEGEVKAVTLHDGSVVRLRKTQSGFDSSDRRSVLDYLGATAAKGEIATGLLYLDDNNEDMHSFENTVGTPLVEIPYRTLCPGSAALEEIQKEWR